MDAFLKLQHDFQVLQEASQNQTAPVAAPIKEPRISLPDKYDGTRAKFRGFVNQITLVLTMHPRRYQDDTTRIGLVGTLLTGAALSWFAPLMEMNSPLLADYGNFMREFEQMFGEHDKVRTATTKLRALRQSNRPATVYPSEFRQISCDLRWDAAALISQFIHGLQEGVKDFLVHLPDPVTLGDAISQAIRADNRLYERRMEKYQTPLRSRPRYEPPPPPIAHSSPEDMQIDAARYKPLTQAEKDRRRALGLCLYCGGENHEAKDCPKKSAKAKSKYKVRSIASYFPPSNTGVGSAPTIHESGNEPNSHGAGSVPVFHGTQQGNEILQPQ